MLTIGSLFSGIDGIALGLEWAGLGPVLWQVEKDPFCRRKLAWRYPNATRYDDVRAVGAANLAPVDIICGGFPCQDVSSAGKRAGLAGARSGLWYEFSRIVDECRPRWVVVENVRSGASKWVDPVRGDLEQLGYATLPVPVAASDCGAPHERARVFVIGAIADIDGKRRRPGSKLTAARANEELARDTSGAANAHHEIGEQQGSAASANALSRELRQQPGRGESGTQASESAEPVAHADHHTRLVDELSNEGWPGSSDDAPRHGGWAAEPALARVVHGLPGRVDYERALGNSVVPQCAEVVGRVIVKLLEQAVSP